MKKTWARMLAMVAVLVCVGFLNGCGDSTSVDAPNSVITLAPVAEITPVVNVALATGVPPTLDVVDVVFSATQSFDDTGRSDIAGKNVLTLKAEYCANEVAGDGWFVQYQNTNYFVPCGKNGQDVFFPTDRRLRLYITSALLTDRGYVLGVGQSVDFNADKQEIYTDVLSLPLPTVGYWGYLLKPIITANFKNSDVIVTPYFTYSPPIACDELEVVFGGGSARSQHIDSIYRYETPLPGGNEFKLPTENYYSGVLAMSRVFDLTHNRVLVSEFSYLGFVQ